MSGLSLNWDNPFYLYLGGINMAATSYTVVKGDTVTSIAKKYKVTVDEIKKWNNLSNVNLIHVGQKLVVSADSAPKTTTSANNTTKTTASNAPIATGDLNKFYASEGISASQIATLTGLTASAALADKKVKDDEYESYYVKSRGDAWGNAPLSRSGIFGLPFQFNSGADPRGSKSTLGRVYRQRIAADLPLVIFQVGKPKFMDPASLFAKKSDKDNQNALMKLMAESNEEKRNAGLEAIAGTGAFNETRYYSFDDDYLRYADYVNTMCRFTAMKMGLWNHFNFDIKDLKNDSFISQATAQSNYMAFYADKGTSYSESGNNTTGDSALASGLKSVSNIKREADFLFGAGAGNKLDDMSTTNYNETVKKLTTDMGDPTALLHRLNSAGQTIMAGGNLLFPEIWQDSSYRKSYTIDLKFYSPYGDPESIFLNVYVPFFCIFAMALPRQNSKQGYDTPFIIKMYSKGWFNCDLGMIDSIDVRKGGGSGTEWTIAGLPTEIDVTLNIKDLYPTLMLTMARGTGSLFQNNTGLIEHLNLMSGIDLHGVHLFQNLIAALGMRIGAVANIPDKTKDIIAQAIGKGVSNVVSKWLGGIH